MKRKFQLLYWLAAAMLFVAGCSSDDGADGGKDNDGDPTPPTTDVVDAVSQYDARPFDGKKRGDVFYEIFVRSFADSDGDGIGDLKGITAKLDYLDDLGVAGIWLMPVFTCNSYHGYDIIDFKQVNPDYGTNADLEELIDEAHKLKIRVILDVTPNHTSNHHPWFVEACKSESNAYRDYYHFSTTGGGGWHQVKSGTTSYYYRGDFDSSMPDLNYGPAATCEQSNAFKALVDAANYWVDRGVDGFRLDAVKHVYDNQTSTENPTFLGKFYSAVDNHFRGKSALGFDHVYMVGECWLSTDQMAPYYKGLPALFDFTAWENRLLYAIQNSHAKWFPKDMIAEREVFARYRADFIQATKLSNHDENRARTAMGGSLSLSLERAKIAAAVLLTSSGSPYIYYGEEIGMMGSKQKGDENVREPMLWEAKASDEYRTTWRVSSLNTDLSIGNVASQGKDVKSLYNVYRKFMRLRNTYPALATGEISLLSDFDDASSENKQVMAFLRTAGNERLLVVHNVSQNESTFVYNGTIKRPIADMNRVMVASTGNRHELTMPAYSSIIIEL